MNSPEQVYWFLANEDGTPLRKFVCLVKEQRLIPVKEFWISQLNQRNLVGSILAFGIILRLVQYLYDRSIFIDEAQFALGILNRSLTDLFFNPLPGQAAPFGFLLAEKILENMFGGTELVLRAFPFLMGVLSLILFYAVAKRVLSSFGQVISIGLFSMSEPVLRYSTELKQYSTDLAVALGILLLGLIWHEKNRGGFVTITLMFSIVGSVLIWISHSAVFCLAAVGISLGIKIWKSQDWDKIRWLIFPALFWIGSFVTLYFLSLSNLAKNQYLQRSFVETFAPFPPLSLLDLFWYPSAFFQMFEHPGGLVFSGLAASCFLAGGVYLFFKDRVQFTIFVMPFLLTLFASGLQIYPFKGRLILFLVPNIMILIGLGIGHMTGSRNEAMKCLGICLSVLLFLHPMQHALSLIRAPIEIEETKPVLNYLKQHYQDGDQLYLYYASVPAFTYYSDRYGLEEIPYLQGEWGNRTNWKNYVVHLKELQGHKRVWVLFSHVHRASGVDEEKFFLHVLDGMGNRLETFKKKGASIYLYDLHAA